MVNLRAAGAGELKLADPLANSDWNEIAAKFDEATVFHTREWAQVLSDTYGYKPYYFTENSDRDRWAFCLYEIDSWLTGKRAVCLPFSDECSILGARDSGTFSEVLEKAVEFGRSRGWKTIEVRDAPAEFTGNRSESFLTHELDLGIGAEKIFSGFESSVRRAIRKAEKAEVRTEVRHDSEGIEQYYKLHCITRRKHCLPPQPLKLFQNIQRHLIARGMGFTVLARLNGEILAGAVFLHFRGKGLYKFGASDPGKDQYRPSNLVMWRGIQELSREGMRSLSFGRTSLQQEGLRRYKLGWGSQERKISYVKLDVASGSYASETGSATRHARGNWLFGKLPIPLLKRIGALLYPHIG